MIIWFLGIAFSSILAWIVLPFMQRAYASRRSAEKPKWTDWVKDYEDRWYVVAIQGGIFITCVGGVVGLFVGFPLFLAGNIIGLAAGIAHHLDSSRRMMVLKLELGSRREVPKVKIKYLKAGEER